MKRTIALMISVLMMGGLLPSTAALEPLPEETFSLPCRSAVLMERESGTLLYAKNPYEHRSPASVTKIMTLLLVCEAIDSGALRPEEPVTASARAASMGGSQIWLEEGERMSVAEMVKCVTVVSANDCAVALAEHMCGSEEAFAARMNQRAAELGMENSHFTNCTGLFESDEHYTCAYDIALMSRALLGHEFIRQFTGIWQDSIRDGAFVLTNTNRLVRSYPGCTGLKTGFTTKAMFCLSASAERDGTELIAVIMAGDTSQQRFDAAKTLLDGGFGSFTSAPVPVGTLPSVPVTMGRAAEVSAQCPEAGRVLLRKGQESSLSVTAELPESLAAPVLRGEQIGTLRVLSGEEVVEELPLLAGEDVERLSLTDIWLRLIRSMYSST